MQPETSQTPTSQKMQLEIVQAPDGSGAYIDLPGCMARATIGRFGAEQSCCGTEVLDTETGEKVHYENQEFVSSEELNAVLTEFFSTLRSLPSPFASLPSFALLLSEQQPAPISRLA